MNVLDKLLGGTARVRAMRYFLQNPGRLVTARELAKRIQISTRSAAREVSFLRSTGLVKNGVRFDEMPRRKKIIKKRIRGVVVSPQFPLASPLRHLLVGAAPATREKMLSYFRKKGAVRALVLGGVFVGNQGGIEGETLHDFLESDPRLDLLVVASKMNKKSLERFIKKIEAEVGKELNWALFAPNEFEYRRAMHDKFLHDLFDYPHEVLIDKIGV